jgi:hypothetical protein
MLRVLHAGNGKCSERVARDGEQGSSERTLCGRMRCVEKVFTGDNSEVILSGRG